MTPRLNLAHLCLFQQLRDCDNLIPFPLDLGQHLLQHWRSPTPPIMADDDPSRPQHTQDVLRIERRRVDLRVVRVDAAEDHAVAHVLDKPAHAGAEEARARAEVSRRGRDVRERVGVVDLAFHAPDVGGEGVIVQTPRWLVMEGVVGEFAPVQDDVAQGGLLTANLGTNDEECGSHIVALEGFEDVLRVLGGCIIDGQGHDLAIGLDMPEHVLPSGLEVVDQALWRFVDDV